MAVPSLWTSVVLRGLSPDDSQIEDDEREESKKPGIGPKQSKKSQDQQEIRRRALEKISEGLRDLQITSPSELSELFAGLKLSRQHRRSFSSSSTSTLLQTPTVCIYDLETTGLGKTSNIGIAEIGAIVVGYSKAKGWTQVASFHRFCVPKTQVQQGVPHNHTTENLKKKGLKPFHSGTDRDFKKFLDDNNVSVLVAHNGKRYDHRILYFHGFKPDPRMRIADSIVSFFYYRFMQGRKG